jgi:very-short-patch-repair endonuclease
MANERARSLRKKMTRQEVKLWVHLRALRTLGHHFRRQSPIPPYVVDFECRRSRLIVEVDGDSTGLAAANATTQREIGTCSTPVIAFCDFGNNQVDREMEGVIETILDALSMEQHPTRRAPRGTPPSPGGEG